MCSSPRCSTCCVLAHPGGHVKSRISTVTESGLKCARSVRQTSAQLRSDLLAKASNRPSREERAPPADYLTGSRQVARAINSLAWINQAAVNSDAKCNTLQRGYRRRFQPGGCRQALKTRAVSHGFRSQIKNHSLHQQVAGVALRVGIYLPPPPWSALGRPRREPCGQPTRYFSGQ